MRKIGTHMRGHFVAYLALFFALGGTSIAAVNALPTNSVGSAQIKNGAIQKVDLAKRTVSSLRGLRGTRGLQGPAGPQGPAGATGATGATGAAGVNGLKGDKGDPGTPATKLFASVTADCGSLARGGGATGVGLDFPARCDVRFNQDVSNCVPVASIRGGGGAFLLSASTTLDGSFVQLDSNEIGVIYRDNTGATITSGRPPFQLAVFC
jgi:hypothetical protein